MDPAIRQAYDATRDFADKGFRSGCYAPFVSMYFNTFGDVIACCKNQTFVLGNIAEQRLDGGEGVDLARTLVVPDAHDPREAHGEA